jgi:cell division protein FtsI/penicillin-binding protein 2
VGNRQNLFAVLKNKLSDQEVENLKNFELPGVYIKEEEIRYYPQEELASHIMGFVDANGDGQYGLEEYYDDVLKGKEEYLQGERGPNGFSLFTDSSSNSGADLYLTIDYNIQFMAEKLLTEASEELEIESDK